jgi:hypothetical protein
MKKGSDHSKSELFLFAEHYSCFVPSGMVAPFKRTSAARLSPTQAYETNT